MVVGIRHTSRATMHCGGLSVRRSRCANGSRVTQASRKTSVKPDQQDVQRDLVGRLLAGGALDQRDHAVEERLAGLARDPHHDAVGQHLGAAGHRRAVAAALADHRRRLAGDGRLVHRGDAFDDLAVAGDHLAGLDDHQVALAQRRATARPPRSRRCAATRPRSPCALAQRVGLRLAAPSAIASAKLANSTVNQSQTADRAGEPSGRRWRGERDRG